MGAGILGLGGWPMGLGRRPLGAAAEATRCLGCARNRYSFASRALALAAHSLLSAIAESDRCRSDHDIETRKHRHKQQSATIELAASMQARLRSMRSAGRNDKASSAPAGRR